MPEKKALKIGIMPIDEVIKDRELLEVTSPFSKASDGSLHEDGLFSETIFGEYASPERLATFGFIDLHCKIIHPRLFQTIMRLKRLYKEICSGKEYAIFDSTTKDFEKSTEYDPHASTGYHYFMKHVKELQYKETESLARATRIRVINAYQDKLFITKYLVLPAGLRDITLQEAHSTTEEINKLYGGLLHLAAAVPVKGYTSPIYDTLRYALQRKAVAIYEYIKNITDGKGGFFQHKYSRRAIALGTRNVISPADMSPTSPGSAQAVKSDETVMPLFQTMKGTQPVVMYYLKSIFFGGVVEEGAAKISVIHPKSYAIQYVTAKVDEKDKFLTSEGMASAITRYRDPNNRHLPVSILDDNDKPYYLYLTYQDNGDLYLIRSLTDFKKTFKESGGKFDAKKVRPLTWAEMFYIATYYATLDKHVMTTRYPITGPESVYPAKVHLVSTAVSDEVTLRQVARPESPGVVLPHFPRFNEISTDSTSPHPSMLALLGGD